MGSYVLRSIEAICLDSRIGSETESGMMENINNNE